LTKYGLGYILGDSFHKSIWSPWAVGSLVVIEKVCSDRSQDWPQRQGDQIGRIFASWAIVCFGQFFENYKNSPNLGATSPHGKSPILILTKYIWAGLNFGQFFHKLIWSPCPEAGLRKNGFTRKSSAATDTASAFDAEAAVVAAASPSVRMDWRAGVDFMKPFRPEFTDKNLIWSNLSL
jgi:hypothetical protein